jgi:hypothetical protein
LKSKRHACAIGIGWTTTLKTDNAKLIWTHVSG